MASLHNEQKEFEALMEPKKLVILSRQESVLFIPNLMWPKINKGQSVLNQIFNRHNMERWASKVAVVTGVSSGIGAAVAQELVSRGMVVVGLSRNKDKVQELADSLIELPGKLYPIECDITNEDSILSAFKWIREELGNIEVLINNAGITKDTTLTEGTLDEWRSVFEVNVFGLCLCTRESVRSMREGNIEGLIIHVSSLAGERIPDIPGFNVYPSTKRAIIALAETLRHELRSTKIRVSTVSPGLVATQFLAGYTNFSQNDLSALPSLRPKDVADAILYILSTPAHVQVQDLSLRPFGESW